MIDPETRKNIKTIFATAAIIAGAMVLCLSDSATNNTQFLFLAVVGGGMLMGGFYSIRRLLKQ